MLKNSIEYLLAHYGRRAEYPTGDYGVEIEIEGRNLPHLEDNKIWIRHEDHSLRGESAEFVLQTPLSKEKVNSALHYLEINLKGSMIHNSNRTSVHIHRNVIPWLIQEVYTLVALYYIFEDLLVRFSGEERQGNMYCLRCSDAEYIVLQIIKTIADESYITGGFLGDNIRYSSLNLKPLLGFGSLEFRSFRGSTSPKEIMDWIEVIDCLCKASKEFNSPRDIVERFQSSSRAEFAHFCFGDYPPFLDYLLRQSDLNDLMLHGFAYSFEIAYAPRTRSPWINVTQARKEHQPAKMPKTKATPPIDWAPAPALNPGLLGNLVNYGEAVELQMAAQPNQVLNVLNRAARRAPGRPAYPIPFGEWNDDVEGP